MPDPAFSTELSKVRALPRYRLLWLSALLVGTVPVPFAALYYREERLGSVQLPLSEFDPVGLANSQLALSAIFLVVFGVMLAGHEFVGGAERGSALLFASRTETLIAKVKVAALAGAALAAIAIPFNFVITNVVIGAPHSVSLFSSGVIRSLVGASAYLILMTIFAVGLGVVVRSSLVAVTVLFPLLLMVSTMLSNAPVEWLSNAAQLLPDLAGAQMMRSYIPGDALLGPYSGGLVLVAWAVVAMSGATLSVRRRDIQD